MKNSVVTTVIVAGTLLTSFSASAQFMKKDAQENAPKTEVQTILDEAEDAETPVIITLEQALEIALSENVSVKVADMEIERTGFAKKGTYAALFPQIDASGAYQRTIKKQVMYMDFDMSSLGGMGGGAGEDGEMELPDGVQIPETDKESSNNGGGLEVGRWNTWSAGVTAAMPLVNAQLWKSITLSGLDVELAVEKARSSRLETVTQVKNAYFATLLAKEAFDVYKQVYENAVSNYEEAKKKFDAEKVSEMELLRAKTTVANAIPNVYNAESSVILSLWQLKAVLGVDLDMNLDIAGQLNDYAEHMLYDVHQHDSLDLDRNSTMRQLAIQSEMLAETIKLQKYANIPSLALAFNFSMNAMTNDFNFSEYRWTPYSYVGFSLNIPIFAGGKRYQQIRQAKNQYQQVELQTENTERQLKIAIRQSLTTMETNMKSYYAAQDAVASAAKGYSIAEKAYQVGRSTLIELNDAQLALTQAQLAESQAIYNFVVAKSQLEQTLGQDFIE
ncbi:MAG: TolC family protein [Bacteroidales bacterium]|nr:TolC family protein [Bacteroidales bacterium]